MDKLKNKGRKQLDIEGEKIYVRNPSVMEVQKADWEYSRVFNSAIEAGIVPREVQMTRLMKCGAWTEEDEKRTEELDAELLEARQLLSELENDEEESDLEEIEECQKRIESLNEIYRLHISRLNSFLLHTAENKATDGRMYYLTWLVTEKENGSRYWETYNDFINESKGDIINKAMHRLILILMGYDDMMETLDELEKVEKKTSEVKESKATSYPSDAKTTESE